MSTQMTDPHVGDSRPQAVGDGHRTYRGRALAEILPQIRAELGADAVVTCQREGLVGGIGGFFAQRFIEVEAMPASTHVDLYDEDDEDDDDEAAEAIIAQEREPAPEREPAAFGLLSERIDGVVAVGPDESAGTERSRRPVWQMLAAPVDAAVDLHEESAEPVVEREPSFAEQLAAADGEDLDDGLLDVQPLPFHKRFPAWVPAPPVSAPLIRASKPDPMIEPELTDTLVTRGVTVPLATRLLHGAKTHDLPFARESGLREALRSCIARLLPRFGGLPHDGALVAVVGGGGTGKTRCAAAIAAAYSSASSLDVRAVVLGRYDSGAQLSSLLEPHGVAVLTAERGSRAAGEIAASRRGQLVVADTPTVSPADPAGIGILGVELSSLAPEEVFVALPATMNLAAGRQMLTALAPLQPTAIVVTHADETDQLGVAVEISIESGLPIAFIHRGLELPGALAPTDPARTAAALLP
ncbi:MAG: hypothetical protein ABSG64_13510 [Solirubrobacteraceae bacterium]|jgi:Meckel syndrome type 1 protein